MTNVFQVGSEVIRAKASDVNVPLDANNKSVVETLVQSMRDSNLVGMAAPQIGVSKRIFVTEIRKTKFRDVGCDPLRVFLNPTIESMSEERETAYEGCGSVAESNIFGEVERSKQVTLSWISEDGEPRSGVFEGFLARIIQHEYDHLQGIVFLDKLSTTKTVMSASEFQKRPI